MGGGSFVISNKNVVRAHASVGHLMLELVEASEKILIVGVNAGTERFLKNVYTKARQK